MHVNKLILETVWVEPNAFSRREIVESYGSLVDTAED